MNKSLKLLFYSFLFLILPLGCWAVEYQPWIGNYFEFEWRSAARFQHFRHLSTGSHFLSYPSDDLFISSQLGLACKPPFSFDMEGTLAWTREQKGSLDHIRLNARYVWLNDLTGDPVTLTTGASLIYAPKWSLDDPSSFHHGRTEAELFVSVGKEWSWCENWDHRVWAMGACGFADRGLPWIRLNLSYGKRLLARHEFELFARTLWGLGHKSLHLCSFHGYGPIQHQSVDLGFRYTYLIEFIGNVSLEYAGRVYTRNFPVAAQQITLSFLYVFGP